ncbi:heavy-metal-associated domain-containing protein [Brevibacterium casei]|uniref:Copper chaperone CopZ n=1 Tax=Brevibacterium antiquum TaxID=234835 RepID=A0A2H1K604_9MICO|nr:heavy-metal-associated domain-containing protein [Brevibacterium antiquum]SMX95153.1 Copper chaperone CopZ [Brevibacterium antiquum]
MTQTSEFTVSGMTCGHCEMSVREEIEDIPGVAEVDVSHQSGKLVVTSKSGIDDEVVINAVEEAGYQAVPA